MSDESYPGEADEAATAEAACIPPPRQEGMTREEPTVDWKATCEIMRETITRLRASSDDLVEFFTQNHEDVGEELYGRVNGTNLTPSAVRLNELLTALQQALRETGA